LNAEAETSHHQVKETNLIYSNVTKGLMKVNSFEIAAG
jgi:hypothetical protein